MEISANRHMRLSSEKSWVELTIKSPGVTLSEDIHADEANGLASELYGVIETLLENDEEALTKLIVDNMNSTDLSSIIERLSDDGRIGEVKSTIESLEE